MSERQLENVKLLAMYIIFMDPVFAETFNRCLQRANCLTTLCLLDTCDNSFLFYACFHKVQAYNSSELNEQIIVDCWSHARVGHLKVIDFILSKGGSDRNVRDHNGKTVLYSEVERRSVQTIEYLLKKDAMGT